MRHRMYVHTWLYVASLCTQILLLALTTQQNRTIRKQSKIMTEQSQVMSDQDEAIKLQREAIDKLEGIRHSHHEEMTFEPGTMMEMGVMEHGGECRAYIKHSSSGRAMFGPIRKSQAEAMADCHIQATKLKEQLGESISLVTTQNMEVH